ncbi:MAG: hypothetical protein QME51_09255, partial [Planctomycetota bacterium]|nr:hypothetical protein [Planctomycetota bacterium]
QNRYVFRLARIIHPLPLTRRDELFGLNKTLIIDLSQGGFSYLLRLLTNHSFVIARAPKGLVAISKLADEIASLSLAMTF